MRIKDRHQYRPRFEALESWVPLSGAAGAMHAAAGPHARAAIAPHQAQAFALNGTLHGGFFLTATTSSVGGTFSFGIEGKVTPLGQTGDSGRIQTTGPVAQGMATGTLTIAAPKGSLKLQLSGPVQAGPAGLPATLSYTITSGTHSYRGATGSGAFAVSANASFVSNRFGLISLRFLPGSTVTP
jgi:hypothetical protein